MSVAFKCAVVALFFALLLFSPSSASAFVVKEFTPQGVIEGSAVIKIVFDTDVVKSGDVGRVLRAEDLPIRVSPQLPGTGKWLSALTFMYQPSAGYPPEATQYSVKIKPELKNMAGDKLSGKAEFLMSTPALAFRGARQVDFDSRGGRVDYELVFSLPVNPFKLDGYLSVTAGEKQLEYALLSASPSAVQRLRVEAGDGSPVRISIAKGLPSTRGPLGLEKDTSVEVDRDLSLKITNSYARSEYDGSHIYLETSTRVDVAKSRSFIELDPPSKFSVESWGSGVRIRGDFSPRDRVLLKVRKGLPSAEGFELGQEWARAFIFPDVEPSVNFTTQGRFVSPLNESLMLPLSSVNISDLTVSVRRVYDNNVPFVMREAWPYAAGNLGEEIFDKTYELSGGPNEKLNNSIDLRKILAGKKGLFEVNAGRAGGWPRDVRVVNVTDMGATGKVWKNGILVWANSIAAAESIQDATVTVYSSSNQVLASGKTDERGLFKHVRGTSWEPRQIPDLVVCSKGDDTAVLRLENSIWNKGAREYAGIPYPSDGYQGMCYTPRGVFRPGENVPIYALLRNADLTPSKRFPVILKIMTPLGREWSAETIQLSELGMLSSELLLSDASPAGTWSAGVYIPGEKTPVATVNFLVEDFAPPRIEMEISTDKKEIVGTESGKMNVAAKYTFGSAAANLPYEVEASFIPRKYSHPNWPGYLFHDERTFIPSGPRQIANGTLSDSGTAAVVFPQFQPSNRTIANMSLRVGVMEESGRWVYKAIELPYYPSPTLLGVLMPEGRITSGAKVQMAFAAIDTTGASLAAKSAKLTIYRKQTRSLISGRDGFTSAELQTEYIPLENYENIPLNYSSGKAALSVEFPSGGEYFIEVADSDSISTAAFSFYVYDARWGYDATSTTLPDSLQIVPDKPDYKVGDRANINISGNFEGTLMINVETDRVLATEVLASGPDGATYSFDVTSDMAPNAWLSASLVRPVRPDENWTAHRAFGAVPINVDCSERKLEVEIKYPEKLYPNKRHGFDIKILDSSGKPAVCEVVAMLVDDAVLGLTNYDSPDFYKYYTQRRELSIPTYDIYRDLLRLLPLHPAPLTAGGGMMDAEMAMRNASLSPVKASRFKVLTETAVFTTDKNGEAKFSIDIPEFDGHARLMIFAVGETSFGAAEDEFEVADDVVASIALPRALGTNDEFDSAITLFNRTSSTIDLEMVLSFDKLLEAVEVPAFPRRVSLAPSLTPHSLPLKFKAGDTSGVANVELLVKYSGEEISRSTQIPIRPPYPRISKSGSYIIEGNKNLEVDIPASWLTRTRRAALYVSPMPQISLVDMLKFLTDYPYYCLEQTVSGGFALISLPELASRVDPLIATHEQLKDQLEKRLARVQSMQLYSGAFSPWSGSEPSPWLSAYTSHFMLTCRDRSIEVPNDTFIHAMAFLRTFLAAENFATETDSFRSQLGARAYVTYVLTLAGDPPLAWMSYLKDNISGMPTYGRLMLAAAYAHAGEKTVARNLIGEPLQPIAAPTLARDEKSNFDSEIRDMALYLIACNEIDPLSPEAAAASHALLQSLEKTESTTTQEAGFALLALSTFFSYQQDEGGEFEVALLNKLTGESETISSDKNYKKEIAANENSFELQNLTSSRAYVSWVADGVPVNAPEPVDMGIAARIEYFDASGKIVGEAATVKRGERIAGRITLTPLAGKAKNIVAVLPVPAGIEIENPKLSASGDSGSSEYRSYSTFRHEIRDDRLLLFVDELPKTFVWEFDARAVTAGRFTVPPISAEGMYSPGTRSIGATSTLTISN